MITPHNIYTMDDLHRLDQVATRHETPCGEGAMVWRRWTPQSLSSGGGTRVSSDGGPQDDGAASPVVLLHGGSGSWTHWVRTIPVLAQTFEVWAGDIPGLGDSANAPDMTDPQSCGDVIADGIAQLIPAHRQPQLVCFSFGSHVGTLAAQKLGNHLRNMLIIGTAALGIEREPFDFPKEHGRMTDAEKREVHRRVLEILMISDPDRIDDFAIDVQADNIRKARFRSRPHASKDTVRAGLANVHVPLRTIWGAKDVVAYPDVPHVLEILKEHHPELVHTIIPDAGHWVMFEKADQFNAALLEMLQAA